MNRPRSLDEFRDNIVQWAGRIESYIALMDFDAFMRNQMAQDAVIRCLEVIGEASQQILKMAPDFQAEHPELELRQAYRARNRTAHGYGSINLETVWRSATEAAPRMAAAALRIRNERREGS
jgi:uncharacterized protein with HEPN domain